MYLSAGQPLSLELDHVRCERGMLAAPGGVTLLRHRPGVVGAAGPNGSGKTSLLRIIAQLLRPASGSVGVCGRDASNCDDAPARALVGYAPHEPLLYDSFNVFENLAYAARLAGVRRAAANALADAAIAQWDLEPVAHAAAHQLSRGWRQRCSLARADVLSPPVLLLDEPATALDEAGMHLLARQFNEWSTRCIVLLTSHDSSWLRRHSDEMLHLATLPPAWVRKPVGIGAP